MSGNASKAAALALSTFMLSTSFAYASSPSREIPEWMYERYGHQSQNEQAPNHSFDTGNDLSSSVCRGSIGQIARGNILERSFNNGRGRLEINIGSPTSNPTIGFTVEFATKGHRLPEPSC